MQLTPAENIRMLDFISEDDLRTFEGWLKYQGFDAQSLTEQELASWREIFDDAVKRREAAGRVGRMSPEATG